MHEVLHKAFNASCALGVAAALAALTGCSTADANPASRVTSATYGDFVFKADEGSTVNVRVTIGDGALASADSSGSTETASPTQTPTTDVRTRIDARYNDAVQQAASSLDTLLGSGAGVIAQWLSAPGTNTVTVTGSDGVAKTATCADGSCTR